MFWTICIPATEVLRVESPNHAPVRRLMSHHGTLSLVTTALTLFLAASGSAQELPGPGSHTPDELLALAASAYQTGDFGKAEALFLAFERDFGTEPGLLPIIERNKPLIALCLISNGKTGEARPYIEDSLKQPSLPQDVREEFAFWLPIQLLREESFREAQEGFGRFFQQRAFSLARRQEALVLFGTCYVLQNYFRTAAEFFAHQVPRLRQTPGSTESAGRAVVMQLLALTQSEQLDEALALVRAEYPRQMEITQIVAFQTLALQLGSRFLEQERFHDAIACLQRIWPREKLLTHQRERLAELQARRALLAQDPRRQSALFQIDGLIQKVEREIVNFESIEEFDASLRLRLALAFQGLERYREAALIMEDMLRHMKPGPVLESASRAVIQCWSQLERHPKAVAAAENYLVVFGDDPKNPHLPQVLFMQAEGLMKQQLNAEAAAIFERIATTFPGDPLKTRAMFMLGFCHLLTEDNESAIAAFEALLRDHPGDVMEQDAFYWKGMAFSFLQEYEPARSQMEEYLARYAKSGLAYESEAVFRIAYATFCLADYETAIPQFQAYLAKYGDGAPDADETRLLLGDALLGVGRADDGIAAYQSICPESRHFFEEGYFKTGAAFRLLEEAPRMRDHYLAFLETYPASQRMPEAVYWIGWSHVHEGQPGLAKQVYWETIRRHGNDSTLFAMEDLLLALPKVYRRDGAAGVKDLRQELEQLHLDAKEKNQTTLALRALWAEARLLQPQEEVLARGLLIRAAALVDPQIHNPQIVADIANAALAGDNLLLAEKYFEELRRWNPVSYHKASAYKGLGLVAAKRGKHEDALAFFDRYLRAMPGSLDIPGVILEKARILAAQGRHEPARSSLEELLGQKTANSQQKAEALMLLGDLFSKTADHQKAVAYYERLYVAYGKHRSLVARAYYQRGLSLEALNEPGKAFEVYRELQERRDLEEFPEHRLARQKVEELAAFAPPPAAPLNGKEVAP